MDRDLLLHLPVIAAVARRNSFARAAAELQMSPSAVSHAVRWVETYLRQPVFARTTRSVRLTEAGEALLAVLAPSLTELDNIVDRLRSRRDALSGTLRINAPRVALPTVVTPLLKRMSQAHPDLIVEIVSDDSLADIVSQGFDAGIRLGNMVAQDMVAVRLTSPFSAIMVASPDYLATHGTPRTLDDLHDHACIGYRQISSGGIYDWDVRDGNHDTTVRVSGPVRVTDGIYARDLALEGLGIAYVFEPHVADDLKTGQLIQILPHTVIKEPGFFLYFPERLRQSPKLRALLDIIHNT